MITRRQFLAMGAAVGATLLFPSKWLPKIQTVQAYYQTSGLRKFVQPLRGVYPLDPNGIPVAVPDGRRSYAGGKIVAQHYTIDVNEYQDQLHPDLGATTLWGYHSRTNLGGVVPQRHLGGIIVAQKGTPVQLTVQNNLPNRHILPVDPTIMGAEDGPNRITVHLHGGEIPWLSDGGPFSWFDPSGKYGSSVVNSQGQSLYKAINPNLKAGQAEYYYPNNQSARLIWYHDHAVGITRLNAYAGIASAYIIRDAFEASLRKLGLPDFIENGGREIPLVFQEKVFVGADIAASDPTWPGPNTPGSLWYPHVYESRWGSWPGSTPEQLPASAIPEFFGDTMLVNGVVHPFAGVEPRRYRLRILNATQARFLNLQLYALGADGQPDLASRGPDFLVIGSEAGFLAFPARVPSNKPMNFTAADPSAVDLANPGGSLLVAPGERFDVLVDFKGFEGKSFILYNDAPAPFPGGDPDNDHNDPPDAGLTTRQIMRLDVAAAISGAPDAALKITPQTPLGINPLSGMDILPMPAPHLYANHPELYKKVKVRKLTLNEVYDTYGRLIQMLGTNQPVPLPQGFNMDPNPADPNNYAQGYEDPATEVVHNGDIEIWEIANLTMDTHPMHFHLVNVQVLARRSFTAADGSYQYANGVPTYTGPLLPPGPLEYGWKETVKMNPGEVTTVMMRFKLPAVPFKLPASPRTGGNEYVWHCHILEHEEHDMMRPLIVI